MKQSGATYRLDLATSPYRTSILILAGTAGALAGTASTAVAVAVAALQKPTTELHRHLPPQCIQVLRLRLRQRQRPQCLGIAPSQCLMRTMCEDLDSQFTCQG